MEIMLQTTGLSKSFKKQKAVDKVSLNIGKGKVYGLLGPNGAGKSTTLKNAHRCFKADCRRNLFRWKTVEQRKSVKDRSAD